MPLVLLSLKALFPAAALHSSVLVKRWRSSRKLVGDESQGYAVLYDALAMPTRMIAENAGVDGTVVVNNISKQKDKNYGYNADKDEYENLREAGSSIRLR